MVHSWLIRTLITVLIVGCNVLIQKKVEDLSKSYYNQGLEKASIRDPFGGSELSGRGLTSLIREIYRQETFLVWYIFETGEGVAASSEWVISKNLQPTRNIANEYISKSPGKFLISWMPLMETIRKYNNALALCREGHEDVWRPFIIPVLFSKHRTLRPYNRNNQLITNIFFQWYSPETIKSPD